MTDRHSQDQDGDGVPADVDLSQPVASLSEQATAGESGSSVEDKASPLEANANSPAFEQVVDLEARYRIQGVIGSGGMGHTPPSPGVRPAGSEPRPASGRRDARYLDVSSDEMSQTFSELSLLPLTIRFPSGLKLTLVTPAECPVRVSVSRPVWASQTFIVLS